MRRGEVVDERISNATSFARDARQFIFYAGCAISLVTPLAQWGTLGYLRKVRWGGVPSGTVSRINARRGGVTIIARAMVGACFAVMGCGNDVRSRIGRARLVG